MKFYGKKLNSLEELRREKQVLLYAKKHTASESLLDLKSLSSGIGIPGKGNDADILGSGLIGTLLSAALGSKSKLGIVTSLAPTLISLLGKSIGGRRRRHNPIERLAKEVGLGYIKWKAIQMVYRWVMTIVKNDKNKKRAS